MIVKTSFEIYSIQCENFQRMLIWGRYSFHIFLPSFEGMLIERERFSIFISISIFFYKTTEAVAQRCSVKKVFLEISQNSQENTCARISFLIKVQASGLNFAKFLKALFPTEHLRRLPLKQVQHTPKFHYLSQCSLHLSE